MQNYYLGGQAEHNGITVFNNIKKVSVTRLHDDSININVANIQNNKAINLINNIIILRGFFKLINAIIIDPTNNLKQYKGMNISILFLLAFTAMPAFIHAFSYTETEKFLTNLFEGFIRIGGYLLFLIMIKFLPNINQLLKNHAAEHMAINAFENNKQLTVPAIRRDSKKNIRCGTSYFFILAVVYLIAFITLPQKNYSFEEEILIRILMLPLLSGVANECLILMSKLDNKIQSKIFKPLLLLQELTTIHPDDQHLQSAIAAITILQSKIELGIYNLKNYSELNKLLR
tara:strand:+ start:27927 stop:28790 length:864 start_codon:yes stop_codon:yes gene_type:complete